MSKLSIFEAETYKDYVLKRFEALPGKGRGEMRRLSLALRVHTSLLSQVFRGSRDLTLEQAMGAAEYFGFTQSETDAFVTLVELARAGSPALRKHFETRLSLLKK